VAPWPPLEPTPDPVDAVVQTTIDGSGGRIATSDGRVVIDVPPGATDTSLTVRITRKDAIGATPPSPDHPFVGLWRFDAFDNQAGLAPVHSFATDLTVTMRFTPEEVAGRNPDTIMYWTFDEVAGWTAMAGALDTGRLTLTVATNHFSDNGATADKITDLAPLLDAQLVDVSSGASRLAVPIAAAPGQNGLAPSLSLTYDSGRLGEMRQYSSVGSWAGQGWDVDTGSISISHLNFGNNKRVFLNLGGFGGELFQEGTESVGGQTYYIWRVRNEQYAKIRTACTNFECPWTVTDKSGRVYTFGSDEAHRRWYGAYAGGAWGRKYYRLDLASEDDILGNRIEYAYWRQLHNDCSNTPCYEYVMAAYPSQISYNRDRATGTFQASVIFNHSCEETPTSPPICMRKDTPRDATTGGCAPGTGDYKAPKVLEIGSSAASRCVSAGRSSASTTWCMTPDRRARSSRPIQAVRHNRMPATTCSRTSACAIGRTRYRSTPWHLPTRTSIINSTPTRAPVSTSRGRISRMRTTGSADRWTSRTRRSCTTSARRCTGRDRP
jgi:hypothetical protein